MHHFIPFLSIFSFFRTVIAPVAPSKIYGVNLGSWLLLEPWMLPNEWVAMGGQVCDHCSDCIASEFAFAEAYPDTVDEKFSVHWSTWFNQSDVDVLKSAQINTVRIPLGFWIVEALVDRNTEHYPRGGMSYLSYGLKMLRDAGIRAILDHHALPGVQTPNQMFAGKCTSDVQFYTEYNYGRALIWTSVMTALSHLHPNFESVFAIQAANEPIMDANQTPGYGDFQKNFVRTVRATELLLGISVPGYPSFQGTTNNTDMKLRLAAVSAADNSGLFQRDSAIVEALTEAIPILLVIEEELGFLNFGACQERESLTTNFMDILWQYNDPANPAEAAIGPQTYDHHLYYSFGGVADANEDAYMRNICHRNDIQRDTASGNTPLWYGEWALSTQFDATNEFLRNWADAQKLAYSQDAGWLFWNFKIERNSTYARQWSYLEGLERGYLTWDPSQVHDSNVCAPYMDSSSTTKNSTSTHGNSLPLKSLRRSGPPRHKGPKRQLFY
ncbi:glycoside hydrolase family 5 protein [Multifurca ochricompacta]|uniref:Glycoside hydrolase family 5 protein n=1 Tax=Multifurca ochricompacta TaxID=376703 RepID=A0AAD4QLT3_9AGAM|nr:glycoside hydrolase family 5 protein [Multifurca ochricompacta]